MDKVRDDAHQVIEISFMGIGIVVLTERVEASSLGDKYVNKIAIFPRATTLRMISL